MFVVGHRLLEHISELGHVSISDSSHVQPALLPICEANFPQQLIEIRQCTRVISSQIGTHYRGVLHISSNISSLSSTFPDCPVQTLRSDGANQHVFPD